MIPLPPDLPPDLAAAFAAPSGALASFLARLHHAEVVGSTNDVAATFAKAGALEGTVVVADEQTAGRGRHGRVWQSRRGDGLYVSVVFRPLPGGMPGPETTLITLMAGVATVEAVRRQGASRAELKWPNDIVVPVGGGGAWRKMAGILAEATVVGTDIEFIVLGIGVNLRTPSAEELRAITTSIEEERGEPADRGRLLYDLVERLAHGRALLREGRFDDVLDAWRAAAPSARGRRVEWRDGDRIRAGITKGIDASGHLLVEADGEARALAAGEVRWL
ncbi:MAG: biotin--[acetyl-CoA-carboxylase] ligase [Vicinamibacteraceae bacterium]|nr:biotin--[acetyl-CoA-carboxylase] ligase [Vicinamibacteraceae bacterium]